ncbi:MAG: class I SAM-dependent methyltransferase [Candidatus Omnitrophica bacterium]|nr:class I SAM-dependent methyltransferase [Candidatus Omnitrophota bacterium]
MIKVRNNDDLLLAYMGMAPLALAFERYLECQIYRDLELADPVLDIGCGDGLFAHILFDGQVDTGIDLNPHELERARVLGGYKELITCSAGAIPKPDGSYRTIISNSVLEHIPDLSSVLKEAHRLLVPGGRFYVTVPAPEFEEYTIGNIVLTGIGLRGVAAGYKAFCSRVLWRQIHYKSVEGWKALAMAHGFEVLDGFAYDSRQVCLLNDFLYPFSILDVIKKRLLNRWTLMPTFRRFWMYPFYLFAKNFLKGNVRADSGGLVFLSLRKG